MSSIVATKSSHHIRGYAATFKTYLVAKPVAEPPFAPTAPDC